jgi:hypothetical protein
MSARLSSISVTRSASRRRLISMVSSRPLARRAAVKLCCLTVVTAGVSILRHAAALSRSWRLLASVISWLSSSRLAAVLSLFRPLLASVFSWLSSSRLADDLSRSWPLLSDVFSWLSSSRLADDLSLFRPLLLPLFSLGFPIHDLHLSVLYPDF